MQTDNSRQMPQWGKEVGGLTPAGTARNQGISRRQRSSRGYGRCVLSQYASGRSVDMLSAVPFFYIVYWAVE